MHIEDSTELSQVLSSASLFFLSLYPVDNCFNFSRRTLREMLRMNNAFSFNTLPLLELVFELRRLEFFSEVLFEDPMEMLAFVDSGRKSLNDIEMCRTTRLLLRLFCVII